MLLKQAVMLALTHPCGRLCSVLACGIPSLKTVDKSISGRHFTGSLRWCDNQTRAGNLRWKMNWFLGSWAETSSGGERMGEQTRTPWRWVLDWFFQLCSRKPLLVLFFVLSAHLCPQLPVAGEAPLLICVLL